MALDLGSGVSRVLSPDDIAYKIIVWRNGNPPSDAELNLMGQINTEERANLLRSSYPSGWIGDAHHSDRDYYSHVSFANFFYLGRQNETDSVTSSSEDSTKANTLWANVNGWLIPVVGTNVNDSTTLNDSDFRNKIVLPFAPTSGHATNFVFLEVWKRVVKANPSTDGKPSATSIYKYGNVEFGGTNPTDDIILPEIGSETTLRAQLQYRIRVISSVDTITYPTGFEDTTNVFARCNQSVGDAADLASSKDMAFYPVQGDPGLWRAGDGDPDNGLGTVDGYSYAVPICAVPRLNRGGWSVSTNNGGISRKSTPTGYVEGNQDNGCPLNSTILSTVPDSDRPDGKYADLVDVDDIIDMRHIVGAHSYDDLLAASLRSLLNNKLAVSPKMNTVGGTQYRRNLLYTDELNSSGTDNPSTILIGEPDGARRLYTDVPAHQGKGFEAVDASAKESTSPSFGADPDRWMPGDILTVSHPSSLSSEAYPSQFLTGSLRVTYGEGENPIVAGFVTGATASTLSSTNTFSGWETDDDQWQGFAVEIVAGTGSGQTKTVKTVDSANQITIFGSWDTTPDITSAFLVKPPQFVVTFTADTTELTITVSSINGDISSTSTDIRSASLQDELWVEYDMLYPAGQGLSLVPDTVHRVNYTNASSASTVLVVPETVSGLNPMKPAYLHTSPDFGNRALSDYFGDKVVERDCYVDEGSKTVVIQPWQRVQASLKARRHDTYTPSHSYYSLFDTNFALEVPEVYLPSLGYNAIPALSSTSGVFFSGLTVWAFDEDDAGSTQIAINLLGRSDFDDDSFQGTKVLARKSSLSYEAIDSGTTDKLGCRINPDVGGIELPRYIGPARIFGIYESADFDSNGLSGTNLLAVPSSNDAVTENIWVGRTTGHDDVTFTVLPSAIVGYSASTEYVIVANLFGYRPGFITENSVIACHEQVTGVDDTVTLSMLVTRPAPSSAVVQISYTRTPYQGSIYSRLEPFAETTPEPFNNRGLVSPTDLTSLNTALSSIVLGNSYHYEVLATREFVTSLGTGRFTGVPTGEWYNKSLSDGYPSGNPQIDRLPMSDVSKEWGGFITRLPLGARYRDADFVGEDLICGAGRGPVVFLGDGTSPTNEIVSGSGISRPLEAGTTITVTEGNNTYSTTNQYRATRGGSGYFQSLDEHPSPAGSVTSGGRNVAVGFRVLHGVAALVRSYEEKGPKNFDLPVDSTTNPSVLKGREGELHMVIMTTVVDPDVGTQNEYLPQKVFGSTSPAGVGEGYTAIDRYRVIGRPLEHQKYPAPFSTDTSQLDIPQSVARTSVPVIQSVFPTVVEADDEVTIRGTGLKTVTAPGSGRGARVFLRPRTLGPGQDWDDQDIGLVESTNSHIKFRWPSSSAYTTGVFDLMVQAGDGKTAVRHSALRADSTVSNTVEVVFIDNFLGSVSGAFPSGWLSNGPGLFRVTDLHSTVGHLSGHFQGQSNIGSDIVRRTISAPSAQYGSTKVSFQMDFRLQQSALDSGETLTLKLEAGPSATTFADCISVDFSAATSFYTFTLYTGLTGGSSNTTALSTTTIDTSWHNLRLEVTAAGVITLYLDDTIIHSSTGTGIIISSNYTPNRIEIDNTVSTGATSTGVLVDGIFVRTG